MRLTTYPPFQEGLNLGDLLKFEADNLYSRDRVTVAPNQTLVLGQVIGRLAGSNHITALDPAATDGREVAVGVVIVPITTTKDPSPDGLIVARHATVADHALVWPAAITPEHHAAAVEQLRAIGILVRHGV
ncbi:MULTISPECIES: head decoration protein [unclassified Lysobacter]|uniref:head decoration protein n=1 Tax=unclassified Lysobacter TaxID=2635362 RepID=UPI001BE87348|nr:MULTISPECIES: head decoration protein [unclassified Lysobacter]MBT2748574.1 head decoration protein [Lysobacter sp. ISL-42]MBT2751509.1 head decoration protein [Lysobacter sp. ISL-50]MBT2775703.1 head decoration protein [Lysobacter sp. ISL-54]MBT2782332.1 head decoration protein [Lysobacter sp. ISL-52]